MATKMFTSVSLKKPKYSRFDLSYSNKFTTRFGKLFPVFVQETLPGDIFNISAQVVVRTTPLVSPIMDKIDMCIRYFFVPNRLVWDGWEEFITGDYSGDDPENNQGPAISAVTYSSSASEFTRLMGLNKILFGRKTLADAFGLPVSDDDSTYPNLINGTGIPGSPDDSLFRITALPFAAYNKIFFDYYVDENVDNMDYAERAGNVTFWQTLFTRSNSDVIYASKLRDIKYTKNDYFTSSLPFPQRGTMPFLSATGSVDILSAPGDAGAYGPLTGKTYITFDDELSNGVTSYPGVSSNPSTIGKEASWGDFSVSGIRSGMDAYSAIQKGDVAGFTPGNSNTYAKPLVLDAEGQTIGKGFLQYREGSLVGEFSNLGITADDLRYLFATQEYLERNMRGGARYTEYLINHFGIFAGDARLQRSEYLGSIKSSVFVGDIPQTSENGDTPQGTLKGKGVGAFSGHIKKFRCREHGYIFGLMTFVPKLSYIPQGIRKKWRKMSPLDYYIPEFSHLGEQPVYRGELYFNSIPSVQSTLVDADYVDNFSIFGYQGKDAEYRHNEDICSMDMRKDYSFWHLGRKFENQPQLNADFLTIDNDSTGNMRIFADTTDDPFIVNCYNQVSAARMLPVYPTPSTLLF